MNDSLAQQLGSLREKIDTVTGNDPDNKMEPTEVRKEAAAPTYFPDQPRSNKNHPRRRVTDRTDNKETGFGNLGPDVVHIMHGGTKTSMHVNEEERKALAHGLKQQQKAAIASSWADIASRFGTAALSVVGAIAVSWAMVQGVKKSTNGD